MSEQDSVVTKRNNRGYNLHSELRSSRKRYTSRPHASCRSAREAWDLLTRRNLDRGGIIRLFLDYGCWLAEFADGEWDEIANTFGVMRALRKRQ